MSMIHPRIIQGGMGVGVSGWRLARAVAAEGQLGVVSGTAINASFARRLQDGDPGGHLRRALDRFPDPAMRDRVLIKYASPAGKPAGVPYRNVPMFTQRPGRALLELTLLANFVEVTLAKEGHDGVVGINLLEKIQMPTLPSLYGAMLAGVDYVLMGAGIPREIPAILDLLSRNEAVEMRLAVEGARPEDDFRMRFDPREILPEGVPPLTRPHFLAIVASDALATTLARKSSGRVDGFVIEGSVAGGHNAPPRGPLSLSEKGEPVYGPRDRVDLQKIRDLGLPFWLAGGCADPRRLREALDQGAAGVQIGTAFAFCRESAIEEHLKQAVLRLALRGGAEVFTDPLASPTGFPFKVLQLDGSVSRREIYERRPRRCDLGFLRRPYRKEDGTLGYRCASESPEDYVAKGGSLEETVGRKCLCNGLAATIGLPQVLKTGYVEPPILTSGDCVNDIVDFIKPGETSYSALDVLRHVLEAAMPENS